MSTESNDQYRAGFEAWAEPFGYDIRWDGTDYFDDDTRYAFQGWTASKREASTEPSATQLPWGGITHQLRALIEWAYDQGSRFGDEVTAEVWFYEAEESGSLAKRLVGAGALTDDAKSRYAAYVSKCQAGGILPCSEESFREDAKDAARYRWWRTFFDSCATEMPDAVKEASTAGELDNAIDAAIEAHARAGSGK
jgi:hypothetical protein